MYISSTSETPTTCSPVKLVSNLEEIARKDFFIWFHCLNYSKKYIKSPQKSDMGKTPFLSYRFAQLYLFPGSIGPEIFYLEIASIIYHSKAFFMLSKL